MVKSMTGYGRGSYIYQGWKALAEIRAVNHRFAEVVIRLPRDLTQFEDWVRRKITARVSRGRLDVNIGIEVTQEMNRAVKIDKALLLNYYYALRELEKELRITGLAKAGLIAKLDELLAPEKAGDNDEALREAIDRALEIALDEFDRMRGLEGNALVEDIAARIDKVESLVKEIDMRAPVVVEEYRGRLQKKLEDLLKGTVDEVRLVMEAAIVAERMDITEEVIRIRSHLGQFRKALASNEPVGRKLDFMLQEFNREVNTIGSKSQDAEIARMVWELKNELEKVREQVQNIE